MDFSLKQALGVVVVIAIAALCITAAIVLTNSNNNNATEKSNKMWEQAGSQIGQNP